MDNALLLALTGETVALAPPGAAVLSRGAAGAALTTGFRPLGGQAVRGRRCRDGFDDRLCLRERRSGFSAQQAAGVGERFIVRDGRHARAAQLFAARAFATACFNPS